MKEAKAKADAEKAAAAALAGDMAILVSVKQLHVVHCLKIDILVREVKLLTALQNYITQTKLVRSHHAYLFVTYCP